MRRHTIPACWWFLRRHTSSIVSDELLPSLNRRCNFIISSIRSLLLSTAFKLACQPTCHSRFMVAISQHLRTILPLHAPQCLLHTSRCSHLPLGETWPSPWSSQCRHHRYTWAIIATRPQGCRVMPSHPTTLSLGLVCQPTRSWGSTIWCQSANQQQSLVSRWAPYHTTCSHRLRRVQHRLQPTACRRRRLQWWALVRWPRYPARLRPLCQRRRPLSEWVSFPPSLHL